MWEENNNLLFLHLQTPGQIVYFHIYLSFIKKTEDLQIFQIWGFFLAEMFHYSKLFLVIIIPWNFPNELACDL